MSAQFGGIDGNNHFLQKSAQKLFAIAIRGGRCRPDFMQIGTERENFLFLFLAQHARALSFPPFELRFCSGEIAQAFFPLGFESACHESVFGLNGTILTLGSFGFVASAFHRQTPLTECCIVVRFELLYGDLCCFEGHGRQSFERSVDNGLIDLNAAHVQAIHSASVNDILARAMVAGRCGSARVVSVEPTATLPTDFANPHNSTFTGTLVPVAAFDEICARAITVACVPEPPPGEKLDGLSDRVMFRLAYRNFGDHEALVVNHTVAGGPLAAVRWYEIRSPGAGPFIYQQETLYDPNINFWLGSIAMDKNGDIALGFSASSRSLFPSIYESGRAATDPLGSMSGPLIITNGTGSQFNSFDRWGDYSSMSIDPTDDCTFWYTNEYYQTTSSFNWHTRVGSFRFNSCKRGP